MFRDRTLTLHRDFIRASRRQFRLCPGDVQFAVVTFLVTMPNEVERLLSQLHRPTEHVNFRVKLSKVEVVQRHVGLHSKLD